MKKYTSVCLRGELCISSSGHGFIDVTFDEHGQTETQTFLINGSCFLRNGDGNDDRKPQYLIAEVLRLIREAYQKGSLKVFEYDRDRNKRYENLRYFDKEQFERFISAGKRDQDATRINDPEGYEKVKQVLEAIGSPANNRLHATPGSAAQIQMYN